MRKTKETITRAEAKKLMWEYYRDNKWSLPKWIGECRDEILEKLMTGIIVESAFTEVIELVEDEVSIAA